MPVNKVDSKTLKQWIDQGQALIIDVREPAEHRSGKIKGSHNISHSEITKENIPELGDKKLVLHCQSGRRSSIACQTLLSEHPELEIYELEGGISAWTADNLDIEVSGKKIMPLDQQVQVTIGSLLLIFALLTLFVHIGFILLIIALGCGLLFAGLSGTCTLAVLLSHMPWNK